MGSRIAAHFANAGVPSLLLDLTADIARKGVENAAKQRPGGFFVESAAALITPGGFDADLPQIAACDWVLEAITENLEIKRSLWSKVDSVRAPYAILSTNTSGIPLREIAQGFSEDFRRRFLGSHFFNPPRYLHLLELIPGPATDPALLEFVSGFAERRLGKGVVRTKDTPNFIGNRIGTFSVLNVMRLMQEMDLTIEEIDALTGQAVGWPKSATFRTIDLVGLDILGHVVANMTANVRDEHSELRLPNFFNQMMQRKWLGDKSKGGFYKKGAASPSGESGKEKEEGCEETCQEGGEENGKEENEENKEGPPVKFSSASRG